ncbi:MAG: HAMP domain-containing protein [Myxococcaceae bacterium]|nr:HAMP domain-containing protein [Myxococcaceae bacterium]
MRLRTRLALAFALLAVLPLLVVVPLAIRDLRHTLSGELNARTRSSTAAARAALERTSEDVRRAIEELAQSVALEDVAREVRAGGSPQLAGSAERLMKSRGLTVLSLFDSQGTTLSSGHLPARIGDPDEALFSVARAGQRDPVPVLVELRDAHGLRKMPALVTARSMDYGALRIWVVGGVLLDQSMVDHLANLAGAEVRLRIGEDVLATAGTARPPVVTETIALPPVGRIELDYSRAALLDAEQGIVRAFGTLVAIGLALSVLLGLLIARRITRPVEALTSAAREVSQGRLTLKVEERASGEVGELVQAFNRMTADLRTTTEQLVASERVAAWQEVARRLAHEIKNPLTPIQMSLETLLAAKKAQSPRFHALFEESAGAVLEEVERLRRIVDEFSRFARLPRPKLEALDAADLVAQVLALYAAPRPGIALRSELEQGLRVRADRDQLTQVLVNLVKNAEEALGEKGGTITVRARRRDAEVALEVEDDGPGIRPEDRARLFEPYFTTKEGGTGLGLAIAARISQEHGGRLEVGGEPGKGAVFSLLLPVADTRATR